MINPEERKLLEELPKTQFGVVLAKYLKEETEKIRDIHNCTSWEETLGRQHADKLVEKLFFFMEKKEEVAQRGKNTYT